MKISFVVPCYNAAENIRSVVREMDEAMKARPEIDYEIVLVNDASPKDDTWGIIRSMADERNDLIAVDLAKNVGQPSALLAGLAQTTGDLIMTSDDDGQTPVGEVFRFLDTLIEGDYDVVCARYVDRVQPSWFRRMGSRVNRWMSDWLIPKPEGVYMSAFFMARRFVVDEMLNYPGAYPYLSALILRVTQNVGNVDTVQRSRRSGNSGYTFHKLFSLWLNGLTSMSVKPLRLANQWGFVISILGFIMAIYTIIRKLVQPEINAGWTSIVALILFLNGIMLIFMGLIGEYIGRIYSGVNVTPQYVPRAIVGGPNDTSVSRRLDVPGASDAAGTSGASGASGVSGSPDLSGSLGAADSARAVSVGSARSGAESSSEDSEVQA